MNIGIFTDCYHPQINGVVTSTMTLKAELEKKGHTVTIVTVKVPKKKLEGCDERGIVRIPSIPMRRWKEFRVGLFFPPATLRKLMKLKFDLIHTQTEFSVGMMGRFMGKMFSIPMVHTYHTLYEDYTHYVAKTRVNQKIWKQLLKIGSRAFLNDCDAVIVPSEKTKDIILRYGVKTNINIIPTGIDMSKFKKVEDGNLSDLVDRKYVRTKYGIKDDDKVILTLARISKEKSIDVIIKSLAKYLKSNENVKYLIVGDGPDRKDLEKLAAKKGLIENKNVIFTGRVPYEEIGAYYKAADLFVSASTSETQGLTLYEAMASGVPVIAKYDETLVTQFRHRENALIFNEEEYLPKLVNYVLKGDVIIKALIDNALKTMDEISAENFGEKIEELYKDVIEDKGHNRLSKRAILTNSVFNIFTDKKKR